MISFKIFIKIAFTQIILITLYYILLHQESGKKNVHVDKNSYYKELSDFTKKFQLFLIDIEILKDIQENTKSIKLTDNQIFGINENYLEKLNKTKHVFEDYFNCRLSKWTERDTNIFLKCKHSITIQIAVFYSRNDYFWIGKFYNNENYIEYRPKWFGDTQRLMNSQNDVKEIQIDENITILIPSNIDRFLFDYSHSELRECNRNLYESNLKLSNYKQNDKKNKIMISTLHYITSIFESKLKSYWIGSGTLLGFYRDCGIIPFTKASIFTRILI